MVSSAIILKLMLLLFIAGAAYQDLKKENLNIIYIAAGAIAGIPANIILCGKSMGFMAEGAAVGLILLIMGYASREAIGYGDGLLFTATGVYAGPGENIVLLLSSMIISAICAGILIVIRVKRKKDRIPFVPCVLGGFILMMAVYI